MKHVQALFSQAGLCFLILSLIPSASDASSTHPSFFLHAQAATAKKSSTANTRKIRHSTSSLHEGPGGNARNSGSPKNASKRRTRPPRRGESQQSSSSPKRRQHVSREKTGLSNMCPPLGGPVGAPQLPVLTTKDPRIIERWLKDNVSADEYTILGFDQESIAKPPWKPERSSLPDGPATIQLSTPTSCIIIHLSRCGDGSSLYAPEILRSVINNPKIIKVGVGIDDDALELYRWSRGDYLEQHNQEIPQLWAMTSRFDIGCILPSKNPSCRSGLRELAQKILGTEINKSKKLAMSNWGKRHLTLEQIAYGARDAWVSAAIVEQLQKGNNGDVFRAESLMEMDFLKSQRVLSDMDERATARKLAKQELKEMIERRKIDLKGIGTQEGIREQQLYHILDLCRPAQPPTFGEDDVAVPLF